ncbi:MAG: DUF2125 domain-containing protein [Paracoccaceae bacterium]
MGFRSLAVVGTVAFALAGPSAAQTPLELTLVAYIAILKAQGAVVEFSDRIVGADDSIEFRGLHIGSPDDEFNLTTDWIRFTPQAMAPEQTIVSLAPQVHAEIVPNSRGDRIIVDLLSENLMVLTNAVVVEPQKLGNIDVRLSAGKLDFVSQGISDVEPFSVTVSQENPNLIAAFDQIGHSFAGAFQVAALLADYSFTADGATNAAKTNVDGLAVKVSFDIPPGGFDETFFDGDNEASLIISTDSSASSGNSQQEGMNLEFSTSNGPSRGKFEIADGSLVYQAEGNDANVDLSFGPAMPPVSVKISHMMFDLAAPTKPTDDLTDMRFGLVVTDLVAGDPVWDMIDPGRSIPRDPAVLDIRLAAKVRLREALGGIMSSGGPMASGKPPTELATIDRFDIDALKVMAGGASVEAGGGLDFDNNGPIPMPLGDINVEVNGVQGLTTKLVELGLIDQMQAGMAMGMIMGFGRPGSAPDQFLSDISFTKDGILANGKPIGR